MVPPKLISFKHDTEIISGLGVVVAAVVDIAGIACERERGREQERERERTRARERERERFYDPI